MYEIRFAWFQNNRQSVSSDYSLLIWQIFQPLRFCPEPSVKLKSFLNLVFVLYSLGGFWTFFIRKDEMFFSGLTLSLKRGGEGLLQPPPPLLDFSSCRFCFLARIAIRSFYPPFVQIPMYLWKNFHEKFEGRGCCNNPPSWEPEIGGTKKK